MPFQKPQQKGWVPMSFLVIGDTRLYGDVKIEIRLPNLRSHQLTAAMNQQGRLRRVITAFFNELKENVHELHFLPRWFRDRLCNQEQFNAMVTSIMAGMRPRVLDILNSGGNFSIQQLMSALEPVQSNDDRGAVYTRIYYDFQDRKRLPSQYTGKTNNLAARDSGHEGVKHIETNSHHYRTSRAANHYIMGPICLLNEEQLRTIAEQLFTCLFETYTDAVMNYQDRSGKSQSEKISDVDSYYNDREASLLLMQLARSAFKKADWPGCRSRQSYGAGDGCNWNSPITEWLKGERVIWTQLAFPDNNLLQLQRTPVQIRSGTRDSNDRIYITMEQQGSATLASRGSFEPTVPTELKLPLGTWVWPVIEMTKNGCPHPRSWARLPTKGPWYDWDAANSWALRIEFQRENGNWESTELVSAYPFRPRTAQLSWPGAFNAYAQGIARRRFFNQAVLTHQGRPVWMCDYGIARIKEQKMDWLKQTGTIVDVQPPGNIVRASRMKSQWDMQSELAAVGVNAFGAPFQSDRESTRVRKPERACDSCYLHNLDNRTRDPRTGNITEVFAPKLRTQCQRISYNDPNKRDTCERCLNLARPCTYTRAVEDCPLTAPMARAFLPRPRDRDELLSIPDPEAALHQSHIG